MTLTYDNDEGLEFRRTIAVDDNYLFTITDEVTNVNGGAIALGHPIGMSGNRVLLHLVNELRRRGGGLGAAALCGGGGQGDAAIIQTL